MSDLLSLDTIETIVSNLKKQLDVGLKPDYSVVVESYEAILKCTKEVKSSLSDREDFTRIQRNLFKLVCNQNSKDSWKCRIDSEGDYIRNGGLVGLDTGIGIAILLIEDQISFDQFNVKELEEYPDLSNSYILEDISKGINYMANQFGYSFEQILPYIIQGRKVRRKKWTTYIVLEDFKLMRKSRHSNRKSKYELTELDKNSRDWEFYY